VDSISPNFGKMAKSTDLSEDLGLFVETRSPADVNIVVSAPETEAERMRLHVTLAVRTSAGAGAPSASTVVKV
jgi:hypothetical protein